MRRGVFSKESRHCLVALQLCGGEIARLQSHSPDCEPSTMCCGIPQRDTFILVGEMNQ